jgi:hypothetical protein
MQHLIQSFKLGCKIIVLKSGRRATNMRAPQVKARARSPGCFQHRNSYVGQILDLDQVFEPGAGAMWVFCGIHHTRKSEIKVR